MTDTKRSPMLFSQPWLEARPYRKGDVVNWEGLYVALDRSLGVQPGTDESVWLPVGGGGGGGGAVSSVDGQTGAVDLSADYVQQSALGKTTPTGYQGRPTVFDPDSSAYDDGGYWLVAYDTVGSPDTRDIGFVVSAGVPGTVHCDMSALESPAHRVAGVLAWASDDPDDNAVFVQCQARIQRDGTNRLGAVSLKADGLGGYAEFRLTDAYAKVRAKAHAGQTAPLIEARTSADALVFAVTPDGALADGVTPSPGDVATFDGSKWVASAPPAPAGTPVVRAFPFAFDTPGLLTGAEVYTPTVGDLLLDAWVQIDTAWDGTTPLGDASAFLSPFEGWFAALSGPVDMALSDSGNALASNMRSQANAALAASGLVAGNAKRIAAGPLVVRAVPAKFATADPIKFCVSQDGTTTGADPGSTQGAAVLYLATCTPA